MLFTSKDFGPLLRFFHFPGIVSNKLQKLEDAVVESVETRETGVAGETELTVPYDFKMF